MKSITNVQELKKNSNDSELRLFDLRTGTHSKDAYQENHLKNAVFVDLENQLSLIDNPKNGGRHPLPSFNQFILTLGKLGIEKKSKVVIYDDKYGANAAARFWWMLKAVGHKNVSVLNGGLQIAISQDYPTISGFESYSETEYITNHKDWQLPQVWMDDVKSYSKIPEYLIVDVRESFRYHGVSEPIDILAGHIPNAVNFPYSENLDANGLFLSPKILVEKYNQLFQNRDSDQIIFHCGSGVSACVSLLALDYAGFKIPNLYVGSWSEWSRDDV